MTWALATLALMMATADQATAQGPGGSAQPAQGGGTKAHAARRSAKCRSLRGRDLAPARNVRLVRRKTGDGNDLLGCVLPRGRVYKVASAEDLYTTVYSYRVRQVARAVVLVYEAYGSQYGSSSSTRVWNLRTGQSYAIASNCTMIGAPGPCDPLSDASAPAAFIDKRGRAAAAIAKGWANVTTIAGFSSRGARTDFDFGPSDQLPWASLTLLGNTLNWTHSGVARTAQLSS